LVGGTTFDFGELNYGKAQKILTIINDGTDTLTISNVSASCGCTGTLMSKDHIAPHDSGFLSVSFDTKKAIGDSKKSISLESNDPANKKVRITFTAHVVPILDIDSDYLYFQGKEGSPITQEMTVKNPASQPISIVSVTSSLDNLSVKIQETTLGPGKETTLTAVLTPKGKGVVKGNIEIKTDNPKLPVIGVRVLGLITENKPTAKAQGN
jgi:hypothetical protein